MRTRRLMLAVVGMVAALAPATTAAAPEQVASPATPRCHTIDLRIRAGSVDGAAGSLILPFYLRNITRHGCHTRGFAGMQLLDARGRALPTNARRDGRARTVSLRPGQLTRFSIRYHEYDLARGGRVCTSPAARSVRLIPPDETAYRLVRIRGHGIAPCSGSFFEQAIGGS